MGAQSAPRQRRVVGHREMIEAVLLDSAQMPALAECCRLHRIPLADWQLIEEINRHYTLIAIALRARQIEIANPRMSYTRAVTAAAVELGCEGLADRLRKRRAEWRRNKTNGAQSG